MLNTKIQAVARVHASNEVSPSSILQEAGIDRFDYPLNWIEEKTGIKTLHHGDIQAKPSSYAIPAIEEALKRFDGEIGEIDAVFYCGMNRDMQEPSTAHIIADKIGLSAKLKLDMSDACHGFTAGIMMADLLIKTGQARHVLLCTGENASRGTMHIADRFKNQELGKDDVKSNLGAFTVGDVDAAMILGATDDGSGFQTIDKTSFRSFNSNNNSAIWPACFVDWERNDFAMHSLWISLETIKMVVGMAPKTLAGAGWEIDDIDYFVSHQVGRSVHEHYLKKLGISKDKSVEVYPDYGNLTSASMPVCFDYLEQNGMLEKGTKILMNSTGSGIVVSQGLYVV